MVRRLPDPVNAFHHEGVGILTTQEIGLARVGRPPSGFRSYAAFGKDPPGGFFLDAARKDTLHMTDQGPPGRRKSAGGRRTEVDVEFFERVAAIEV
jgi:hypothetical protein